jgi:hypothetical protein
VAAAADARALATALAALGTAPREPSIFVQSAVGWLVNGATSVWAVVEIARASASADWVRGGVADVVLVDAAGATAATAHVTFAPGAGSARLALAPRTIAPGTYDLRVRARGTAAAAALNDSGRVTVLGAPEGTGAQLFRRGPTTANQEVPTADPRFRRSETVRVMVPAAASATPDGARLLDRTGKALTIPVTPSPIDEADGSRWLSTQISLAPLAPGDYVLETTAAQAGTRRRTLTAFRVVP